MTLNERLKFYKRMDNSLRRKCLGFNKKKIEILSIKYGKNFSLFQASTKSLLRKLRTSTMRKYKNAK